MKSITIFIKHDNRCSVDIREEDGFEHHWITDASSENALANVKSWVEDQTKGE